MTDTSESAGDLLRRFRDGDPEAFRALTEPHLGALAARAQRRLDGAVRKKVSVADVVQEAQIVAFEKRGEFEPDGPNALRNWLLAIVDNRARKAVERLAGTARRDIGREMTREARPATVDFAGRGRSPSQHMAANELSERMRQAMQVLSEEEQRLLRFVHEERLGLREAAARLGHSHDAVKKRHARALVRLGQALRRLRSDAGGRA